MPTKTFTNLPQEKKERIEVAIRDEIVAKGIAEASINQIIKNAGISRGSFYQYFADKEDMMEYMLREFERCIMTVFHQNMVSCRGNIFRCFEGVLDEVVNFVKNSGEFMSFNRTVLADKEINNWFCSLAGKERIFQHIFSEMEPQLKEAYLGKTKDELRLILELLLETIGHTVLDAFMNEEGIDFDWLKRRFQAKVQILEKGFVNL